MALSKTTFSLCCVSFASPIAPFVTWGSEIGEKWAPWSRFSSLFQSIPPENSVFFVLNRSLVVGGGRFSAHFWTRKNTYFGGSKKGKKGIIGVDIDTRGGVVIQDRTIQEKNCIETDVAF